jgi:O-methyltransferase
MACGLDQTKPWAWRLSRLLLWGRTIEFRADMGQKLKGLKRSFILHKLWKRWIRKRMDDHGAYLRFPPYAADKHELILSSRDPVRYTTMALAIHWLEKANVPGSFAEVGVYRGDTSRILHRLAPDRRLYLFDTFEGFPAQDMDEPDDRFRETSVDMLRQMLVDMNNVVVRKGYFPETARGLENEKFAFVMLDVDKYKATRAALEFFYPRLSPRGCVMVHDFNSPESNYAVSKATDEFMADKPEQLVQLADCGGSVLFHKLSTPMPAPAGS